MRILYVFPHPDDESFGPAATMSKQRRQGHDVHLLTLTRGGATRQRHKYGYTVETMGEVRLAEMQNVAKALDLSGMKVLDLPDSGLKEMDPREIAAVVLKEIERLKPHVVVSYPVHGISGFHDHIITHGIVKRVFVEKAGQDGLQRLAFFTITEEQAAASTYFTLSGSTGAEIDCIVGVEQEDIDCNREALDCYVTFRETIEKTGIRDRIGPAQCFEIFAETHEPPLDDLFSGLTG